MNSRNSFPSESSAREPSKGLTLDVAKDNTLTVFRLSIRSETTNQAHNLYKVFAAGQIVATLEISL